MSLQKTWHCVTLGGTHLIGQGSLERLKADDPCWRGETWVTYERRIEPQFRHGLAIKLAPEQKK